MNFCIYTCLIFIFYIVSLINCNDLAQLEIKYAIKKECLKKTKLGDYIYVHYRGRFLNGTEFDKTMGKDPYGFQLGVGQAIKGYDQGLLDMCEGDKRDLTVPPHLGTENHNHEKLTTIYEVYLVKISNQLLKAEFIKSVEEGCDKRTKVGDTLTLSMKQSKEDETAPFFIVNSDGYDEITIGVGKAYPPGLDFGLFGMCIGDKRKLLIPAMGGNIIVEAELFGINNKSEL